MEKIGFIVCQYGNEVNGGAEIHCKMLAERLTPYYDVDVLTSTIINYNTFEPYYKEGKESINGVNVLRFKSNPFDRFYHETIRRKSKLGRKVRRMLFRVGLLELIANVFPKWNISVKSEEEVLKSHGFYSSELLTYLSTNINSYKKLILLSYPYPNTYFTNKIYSNKCILIPTAHNEGDLFRSLQTHLFTTVNHIAFNTEAEKKLCTKVFGKRMSDNSIVAVGVDIAKPETKAHIYKKFNLPDEYILYFGRIAPEKIGNLINWFIDFKKSNKNNIKLVLTGRLFMKKHEHPDIIYTDFVQESEKTALIENARLIVNPSSKESLSLLLLETMQLGKISLVNGKSDVMKQHCIDSNFACQYYLSKSDFLERLNNILKNTQDTELISEKSRKYVEENYSWDVIINKLRILIDSKTNK
ncbi:glycosyltransferase [Sphingobacterium spiritivorum]|uniref:Glycosyltransferase, group 1 family protein n=1 Tax=Sphingobacterium spiritivorum ATCC 33861 TaxID=525373 RepID=D7VJB3_SPHSI|nr:glycosyltransferase [Sphingobacterium spiritivorum]EFK58966.1 glycosyltransferase, group 1 family protein [Sphingobacterium spiritivorum ATCC 33861]QQT36827.1 glycosyltransferase [Sphingobacterium spiritivorum]WQD33584.1 glycosyltransferase [Sphingobacterium spiritivorum]SUJ25248.1 lipopolysaccharide 1,2-N-acetylglucosaminetransferase [Sphingobacterium spiritivorum]